MCERDDKWPVVFYGFSTIRGYNKFITSIRRYGKLVTETKGKFFC